jgi:hypothetical protein
MDNRLTERVSDFFIFPMDLSLLQEVDHQQLKRNMLADGVTLYTSDGLTMAT